MTDEDFALLMEAKLRIEDAEHNLPMSRQVKVIHATATKLIYRFRNALGLTDEQFNQLVTPEGGGTPKTPPGEE